MLSSSAASSGRGRRRRRRHRPTGARSARTSSWIRCSSVGAPPVAAPPAARLAVRDRAAPSTSCISRASRPHDASSGLRGAPAVGSSRAEQIARRRDRPAARSRSHSAGDGCSRKRWTSRPAAIGLEDVEIARRQPGQPEQRQPGREVEQVGLVPQALAGARPGARPGSAGRCGPAAAATARPARPASSRRRRRRRPSAAACRAGARRSGRRGRPRAGCSRSASTSVAPSPELRMCWASGASQGSSKCSSTTSMSGHTARSGSQGSAVGIGARGQGQRAGDQRPRETGSRCWRTRRRAGPGVAPRSRRQPLGEPPLDAPRRAPRRPRASSGRRAARPPARPASPRARRPDRSGGRAAPRQSTSAVFPGDRLGKPPAGRPCGLRRVPVLAPPSGSATMVGCPTSSSCRSG